MNKLAIVFAGQGSQYLHMGLDFAKKNQKFNEKIQTASQILGYNIEKALANENVINQTKYTQPLILVTSIMIYEALKDLKVKISALSGFSLGEYSAFYAANIFDFKQSIKLIKNRAQFMDEESTAQDGAMAAILGLSHSEVDDVCKEASKTGVVVSANYNSKRQVVISGEKKAVLNACELSKTKGAKRSILLNVSGAFHSPLMKKPGLKLAKYLKTVKAENPKYPVYLNTTAKPLIFKNLYLEMEKQVHSPVYFEQLVKQMVFDGITHIIEIGPGNVLSGLIRKIDRNIVLTSINNIDDIKNVKGWLKTYGFNK